MLVPETAFFIWLGVPVILSTPFVYGLACNWMYVDVFAHYTQCQYVSIKTMHQATARCCHSSIALPLLLLLPPSPSSAFLPPPSYLSERSRPSCAGTPRRSAGSRPGRAGNAHGWWWSRGPRWPGYARPLGPGRWWGSPRWPGLPRWLPRHHSAWNLGGMRCSHGKKGVAESGRIEGKSKGEEKRGEGIWKGEEMTGLRKINQIREC